jgi:hypothetical protein
VFHRDPARRNCPRLLVVPLAIFQPVAGDADPPGTGGDTAVGHQDRGVGVVGRFAGRGQDAQVFVGSAGPEVVGVGLILDDDGREVTRPVINQVVDEVVVALAITVLLIPGLAQVEGWY